ncbi:MAG TPA: DUF167 family protein [Methylocella sp.]|nr:DUF167 family protein [Methylocella sp.]
MYFDVRSAPWHNTCDGIDLFVRVTPRSFRDEIAGIEELADGRAVLKVRVRAAAKEGEANEAITRLLAKALAIPARAVRIESGGNSRVKRLHLRGNSDALAACLAHAIKSSTQC